MDKKTPYRLMAALSLTSLYRVLPHVLHVALHRIVHLAVHLLTQSVLYGFDHNRIGVVGALIASIALQAAVHEAIHKIMSWIHAHTARSDKD